MAKRKNGTRPLDRLIEQSVQAALTTWLSGMAMRIAEEYGKGKGKKYGTPDPVTGETYYGRGYVQLTWKDNYQKQDTKLELNGALMADPDLALNPDIALSVILGGMVDGDFTGKKLSDYFTDQLTDWVDARRIVNGTDRAQDIAGYAMAFVDAMTQT